MDKDELKKLKEKALIFKLQLFGNIEFVGELYIRKILLDKTLVSVFEQLLGLDEGIFESKATDQTIEGAINLMLKCGFSYESNVKSAKDKTSAEKKESFTKIIKRFDDLIVTKNPAIS